MESSMSDYVPELIQHLKTALEYLHHTQPQAKTNEFFRVARPFLRKIEEEGTGNAYAPELLEHLKTALEYLSDHTTPQRKVWALFKVARPLLRKIEEEDDDA